MSDDTISRQATLEALLDKGQRSRRYKLGDIWELNFDEIREVINALPPDPQWIPCKERLPEENVYVLVWCGEVEIAQIVYGISKEQRAKMQEGAIDDPVSLGWNLFNGYFEAKRSETYRACDEYGNNKVPYCWDCIDGEMFGQDVVAWMPLPEPYREEFSNDPESTKDRMDNENFKIQNSEISLKPESFRGTDRPLRQLVKVLKSYSIKTNEDICKCLGLKNKPCVDSKMNRGSFSVEDIVEIADYCGFDVVLRQRSTPESWENT